MIIIKTPDEIEKLREGGPIAARILRAIASEVKAGVTTKYLDDVARKLIDEAGGTPAFLGYRPSGERKAFPAALCTSVNDEIVHGIPSDRVLKEGDIITVDLGYIHKGVFLDLATTVGIGKISHKDSNLLAATEQALEEGISAIAPGGTVGDIGAAIDAYVTEAGCTIISSLAGHGVGRAVHEDPYVPNYGKRGKGAKLVPGMVIAIEPIVSTGKDGIRVLDDEYTIITVDGAHAAHFEHTVLITETGAEVLTK
jgi:methionyl aminopeptidase